MANDSMKRLLPWVVGALLLLAAAAALWFALRRAPAGDGPAVDPEEAQYARMHDPAYLKQLGELREEQRQIALRLVKARAALDAAKAKGEGSSEYAAAKAEVDAATAAFNENRAKAQLVVRERMMLDSAAAEAAKKVSNQKVSNQKGE